jgi:arginyl-tRNA synthetase
MNDIRTSICERVSAYVNTKGANLSVDEALAFLETPSDSKLGDLALPCFKLSKLLRARPDGIASELKSEFDGFEGLDQGFLIGDGRIR